MRKRLRQAGKGRIAGILAELLDMLEVALLCAFCLVLLFAYVLELATVQGDSMESTLQDQDQLLVFQLDKNPDCGDVVIVDSQRAALLDEEGRLTASEGLGKCIVKRVIAKGGQTLDIDFENGVVTVDGQALDEPYIKDLTTVPVSGGAFSYPIEIPEGYLFVMGDNRMISKDSRYQDVGLVPESDVDGVVLLRLYPWNGFGPV